MCFFLFFLIFCLCLYKGKTLTFVFIYRRYRRKYKVVLTDISNNVTEFHFDGWLLQCIRTTHTRLCKYVCLFLHSYCVKSLSDDHSGVQAWLKIKSFGLIFHHTNPKFLTWSKCLRNSYNFCIKGMIKIYGELLCFFFKWLQ